MKTLMILTLGLAGSWHFMDLASENFLFSTLCPVLFTLFLIASLISLVTRGGLGGRTSDRSRGDGGFFGGGDGGGDC